MREEERNIRTNLTRPLLELLFSGNTTTELICCPQSCCSITAPTTKTSSSRHFLIKMNLAREIGNKIEGLYNLQREWQNHEYTNKIIKIDEFLSSSGTPATLVDKRSFDFDGDSENFILSPRLIT
uniref:Uncharacterized protein n=1 Tax=Solanum lycopersicum TaxID=4081 RepID=A0A3Q7ESM7_SOLLC